MLNKNGKLLKEVDARGQSEGTSRPSKWMMTLYAQINTPRGKEPRDEPQPEIVRSKYRRIIEGTIGAHEGDVIAIADDAVLATFATPEEEPGPGWKGLRAAVTVMAEVATWNRHRVAQDLPPYRVGIGLDCGSIPDDGIRRHPRLQVGLERHISRARSLSILNCQTPFPSIFLSASAVDRIGTFNGYTIQHLGDITVPDQPEPVTVYALMPGEDAGQNG